MNDPTSSTQALHKLFWRIHFWAGLTMAPVILFAAITGLIYVLSPQIETWRHAGLDKVTAPAHASPLPLDAQIDAAVAALPHLAPGHDHAQNHHAHPPIRPQSVIPAHGPTDTTQVVFRSGGEHDHGPATGQTVYIDPYTGRVLGTLGDMGRFKTWAKKLHSSALQGDGWRWPMELAASWLLVLMITGLTMWWPRPAARGGAGVKALKPRWGAGRVTWRDLHATVAIATSGVLLVVVLTGLTWSKYTGAQFKALQTALHQDAARVPKDLRSAAPQGQAPLSWQAVHEAAKRQAPDIALLITPPASDNGIWRVENSDRSQPTRRFQLALDAYSGQTLFFKGWEALPALPRATAVGIPFHRGEFGVWNQVLLALVALSAIFSVVSGCAMWLKRRKAGSLSAPSLSGPQLRSVPAWLWACMGALALAMPVFGISVLVLSAGEGLRLLVSGRASMA